ncbi:MAG: PAS domain S-box protein [Candidatus Heimdallarchaeota archaeon]|nr:PAS domain S-box protein [Candidatus Heimdallarchaeota archaeon]
MDKIRVLLIDDEKPLLFLMKEYLKKLNPKLEIETVVSAHQALEILSEKSIEVIVSDFQMSEMDGLELLKHLRECSNDIPFIMFTGRGREEVAIQALNLGADYYLQKGGEPKGQFLELLNLIEKSVEKKRAEEALQKSEEQYQRMADNIQDGITIVENQKIVYMNDRIAEIFGYPKEELMNYTLIDLVTPEEKQRVKDFMERAIRTKKLPTELECWIVRKDGSRRYIHNRYSLSVEEDQSTVRYIITTDITKRKLTEEKIIRERKSFQILARVAVKPVTTKELCDEILVGLINALDFDIGSIRLVDEEDCLLLPMSIIGISEEEIPEKVPPLSIDNADNLSAQVARTQKPIFEPDLLKKRHLKAYKKLIKKFNIQTYISWPMLDSHANLLGTIQIAAHDLKEISQEDRIFFKTFAEMFVQVFERKMTEKTLLEAEEKFHSIADQSSAAIIIFNRTGVKFANEAASQIFGYALEEITSWELDILKEIVHPEDLDLVLEQTEKKLQGVSDTINKYDVRFLTKQNETIWISIHSKTITYENSYAIAAVLVNITERKKMEEKLRESEEKYSKLFHHSKDLIVLIDNHMKILDINQPALEKFQYTRRELVKSPYSLLFPKNELVNIESKITEISRKPLEHFEVVAKTKEGHLFPAEIRVTPLYIGQKTLIQFIIRDISTQKKAIQEKADHIENLTFLSDSALEFLSLPYEKNIYEYIGKKIYQLVNDSFIAVASYDAENENYLVRSIVGLGKGLKTIVKVLGKDLVGMTFHKVPGAEQIRKPGKLLKVTGNLASWMERDIPRKTSFALKKMLGIDDAYISSFVYQKKLYGVVVIFLRKGHSFQNKQLVEAFVNQASVALLRNELEMKYRQNEALYRGLIEKMHNGFVVLDKNSRIIYVNNKFCEMSGYLQNELLGRSVSDFLTKETGKAFEKQFAKRRKGTEEAYELIWKGKGAKKTISAIYPKMIRDEEGNFDGSFAVVVDITKQKEFEEKLKNQQKLLRKQRDEIESFATMAAHDIRGKLQIISLYLDLISQKDDFFEYNQKIVEQISEISQFLEDLLLLAKKGEILSEISQINLNEMVNKLAENIRQLCPSLKLVIGPLPSLKGDSLKIKQVFENLLMNIIKHSEATRVEIFNEEDENYSRIFIKDNGIGMTKDYLQKIQTSLMTNEYFSIGLSIVQKILQAHNGFLELESEKGEGTTAIVNFPKNEPTF